jgi:hypothetical protein
VYLDPHVSLLSVGSTSYNLYPFTVGLNSNEHQFIVESWDDPVLVTTAPLMSLKGVFPF